MTDLEKRLAILEERYRGLDLVRRSQAQQIIDLKAQLRAHKTTLGHILSRTTLRQPGSRQAGR